MKKHELSCCKISSLKEQVKEKTIWKNVFLSCLIPYGDSKDNNEQREDLPSNLGHKDDYA